MGIELIPLTTIDITFREAISVGAGPAGDRLVGELATFEMTGERLTAHLRGVAAADWAVVSPDAVLSPDVRVTVETGDGAIIYVTYQGRVDMTHGWAACVPYVAGRFETADPRYSWLNTVLAVGKGQVVESGLRYEWHEVR